MKNLFLTLALLLFGSTASLPAHAAEKWDPEFGLAGIVTNLDRDTVTLKAGKLRVEVNRSYFENIAALRPGTRAFISIPLSELEAGVRLASTKRSTR